MIYTNWFYCISALACIVMVWYIHKEYVLCSVGHNKDISRLKVIVPTILAFFKKNVVKLLSWKMI